MNQLHLLLIRDILDATEARGWPVWLESGWAVDARLGTITREHDDIDLAIPHDRLGEFQDLLRRFGAGPFETMDYGFLTTIRGVLLDCEPCHLRDGRYELEGVPAGACPWEREGVLDGAPVRCTSWDAILWEYFYYLEEVHYEAWPEKDRVSWTLVRQVAGPAHTEDQYRQFQGQRRDRPIGSLDSSAPSGSIDLFIHGD